MVKETTAKLNGHSMNLSFCLFFFYQEPDFAKIKRIKNLNLINKTEKKILMNGVQTKIKLLDN